MSLKHIAKSIKNTSEMFEGNLTELEKISNSIRRVLKAFQGTHSLEDLADQVSEIKDSLKKILSHKISAITQDDQSTVRFIVNRVQTLQNELNTLDLTMNAERQRHNWRRTLTALTRLKTDLLEISKISVSLAADLQWIPKIRSILASMRTRIKERSENIQQFINEVKTW